MKHIHVLFTAALFACTLGGCSESSDNDNTKSTGNGGEGEPRSVDNQAACEEAFASIDCGGFDLGQAGISCDNLSDACDLSDYYTCIAEAFSCNNGVPDASGFPNCAGMSTCG